MGSPPLSFLLSRGLGGRTLGGGAAGVQSKGPSRSRECWRGSCLERRAPLWCRRSSQSRGTNMKTITEFTGSLLRAAEGGEAAAVEAAPEAPKPDPNLVSPEDAEAIGAALNISGDRLSRMCDALAATAKKLPQVQRVRIVQLAENEQPPAGARKHGD